MLRLLDISSGSVYIGLRMLLGHVRAEVAAGSINFAPKNTSFIMRNRYRMSFVKNILRADNIGAGGGGRHDAAS